MTSNLGTGSLGTLAQVLKYPDDEQSGNRRLRYPGLGSPFALILKTPFEWAMLALSLK